MLLCFLPEEKCCFPVRAGECEQESRLTCSRVRSLPVTVCVTVCKCPEGVSLWEEGVVDETTRRENLAGEETRAAQCGNRSGKAGDWLHHRAAVCIAGGASDGGI